MNAQKASSAAQVDLFPWLDVVLALAAFAIGYVMRYQLQIIRPVLEINTTTFEPYIPYMVFYVIWLTIQYRGSGLYRHVRGRAYMQELFTIVNGVTNATVIVMALSFISQPLFFSRLMLVWVALSTVVLLGGARIIKRMIDAHRRAQGIGVERVLIVGAGEVGQAVLRTMLARKELGYGLVGYLDDDPEIGATDLGRVRGLGGFENLAAMIEQHRVNLVVITLTWSYHDQILQMVDTARRAGAEVRVVPDLFQLNLRQVQVENLDGIPLLGVTGKPKLKGIERMLKRLMDLIIILVTLPVILTIFALVALAIWLERKGPIIYAQQRIGENGKPFTIYKFRSMIPDADKYQQEMISQYEQDPLHPKFKDDWRVTRVGWFIRRTSIDELPNLINVVRGQMSLIGPRPPTPDEVAMYKPWHRQRLETMPGITGLWQVSGRSDVPFDEMCLLDIYYIENWSISLDVQILMMTLPRVLLRQGAY
ncbi:MAG: sugar transferase [Anaerolineae bacterium]|nr:MAG: putative glycosyltransferase [Chloroflexi bacterium OLB13]MBW7879468.1 sugar transferase [Anaerolineae bacterium]MEB2367131.1 sugar transferase [Chloroflexota bacterium]